jgi:hypothetical protein
MVSLREAMRRTSFQQKTTIAMMASIYRATEDFNILWINSPGEVIPLGIGLAFSDRSGPHCLLIKVYALTGRFGQKSKCFPVPRVTATLPDCQTWHPAFDG